MAKKKTEIKVTQPLTGKALFAKASATEPKTVSELPAIKPAKRQRTAGDGTPTSAISKKVLDHLHLLEIYGVLSVPDFRGYSNTGDLAATVLLSLESNGLARSKWEKGRRVFRLTPAGQQRLDEGMPAS